MKLRIGKPAIAPQADEPIAPLKKLAGASPFSKLLRAANDEPRALSPRAQAPLTLPASDPAREVPLLTVAHGPLQTPPNPGRRATDAVKSPGERGLVERLRVVSPSESKPEARLSAKLELNEPRSDTGPMPTGRRATDRSASLAAQPGTAPAPASTKEQVLTASKPVPVAQDDSTPAQDPVTPKSIEQPQPEKALANPTSPRAQASRLDAQTPQPNPAAPRPVAGPSAQLEAKAAQPEPEKTPQAAPLLRQRTTFTAAPTPSGAQRGTPAPVREQSSPTKAPELVVDGTVEPARTPSAQPQQLTGAPIVHQTPSAPQRREPTGLLARQPATPSSSAQPRLELIEQPGRQPAAPSSSAPPRRALTEQPGRQPATPSSSAPPLSELPEQPGRQPATPSSSAPLARQAPARLEGAPTRPTGARVTQPVAHTPQLAHVATPAMAPTPSSPQPAPGEPTPRSTLHRRRVVDSNVQERLPTEKNAPAQSPTVPLVTTSNTSFVAAPDQRPVARASPDTLAAPLPQDFAHRPTSIIREEATPTPSHTPALREPPAIAATLFSVSPTVTATAVDTKHFGTTPQVLKSQAATTPPIARQTPAAEQRPAQAVRAQQGHVAQVLEFAAQRTTRATPLEKSVSPTTDEPGARKADRPETKKATEPERDEKAVASTVPAQAAPAPTTQPTDLPPAPRVAEASAPQQPNPLPNVTPAYLDDPTLRVVVLPNIARLNVETQDSGTLSLQVKVHDGVTDIRAAGPAASLVEARQGELRLALAHEGLALGHFDLTQSDHQGAPQHRFEPHDEREPLPRRTHVRPESSSSTTTRAEGRLSVKA